MAKSVWVVFDGIYSDRHIVYVASSKEQADLYSSKACTGMMEISEYTLDEEIKSNYIYKCSVFLDSRLVIPDDIYTCLADSYELEVFSDVYKHGNIHIHRNTMGVHLNLIIEADDAKHAQKIAREWVTMIIATPYAYPKIFDNKILQGIYNFYTKEFTK